MPTLKRVSGRQYMRVESGQVQGVDFSFVATVMELIDREPFPSGLVCCPQARAVVDGLPANVVASALPPEAIDMNSSSCDAVQSLAIVWLSTGACCD